MTADAVAIYLGVVAAGMVVVSIADSMAAEEVATRLRIADARGLFTVHAIDRGGKRLPLYERLLPANPPRAIVLGAGGAPLRPGDQTWEQFLAAAPPGPLTFVEGDPDTVTNILFSSGTTGEPKAIPWTQLTPQKAAIDGMFHLDVQAHDVVAWPTNLGWMMGPWLIYASLLNRATMALFTDAPHLRAFGEFVAAARVTVLGLVPSIVKSWRTDDRMLGLDWSAIKCFGSTGEASNATDYLYLMMLAGYRPVIEYCGGTEIGGGYVTGTLVQPASPATFTTPALGSSFVLYDEHGQPTDNGEAFLIPPVLGYSQRLLNRDHHEVYFAGAPAGANGAPLRRHGDQVERVGPAAFRALGRTDDTMNLGGIKVSSAELERVLDTVPGVRRTAAIAVSPPGGGPSELVVYAVTAGPEPKDVLLPRLQAAIKARLNPLFRISDLVLADALPVTASNKIMRRELRKAYVGARPSRT
jgi:acetyl-CoA synthetase